MVRWEGVVSFEYPGALLKLISSCVHENIIKIAGSYEAPMSTREGVFTVGTGFVMTEEGGFCDLFKGASWKQVVFGDKSSGITFKEGVSVEVNVRIEISKDDYWHG